MKRECYDPAVTEELLHETYHLGDAQTQQGRLRTRLRAANLEVLSLRRICNEYGLALELRREECEGLKRALAAVGLQPSPLSPEKVRALVEALATAKAHESEYWRAVFGGDKR